MTHGGKKCAAREMSTGRREAMPRWDADAGVRGSEKHRRDLPGPWHGRRYATCVPKMLRRAIGARFRAGTGARRRNSTPYQRRPGSFRMECRVQRQARHRSTGCSARNQCTANDAMHHYWAKFSPCSVQSRHHVAGGRPLGLTGRQIHGLHGPRRMRTMENPLGSTECGGSGSLGQVDQRPGRRRMWRLRRMACPARNAKNVRMDFVARQGEERTHRRIMAMNHSRSRGKTLE